MKTYNKTYNLTTLTIRHKETKDRLDHPHSGYDSRTFYFKYTIKPISTSIFTKTRYIYYSIHNLKSKETAS